MGTPGREILAALHRYVRGVDRLDRELVLSAFHPDATLDYGTFSGDPAQFADWLLERMPRLYVRTHHQLGSSGFTEDPQRPEIVDVETYLTAHHDVRDAEQPAIRIFAGRYIDRFELRASQWRIAHRALVQDLGYSIASLEPGGGFRAFVQDRAAAD